MLLLLAWVPLQCWALERQKSRRWRRRLTRVPALVPAWVPSRRKNHLQEPSRQGQRAVRQPAPSQMDQMHQPQTELVQPLA